jgi:hypothetical protein
VARAVRPHGALASTHRLTHAITHAMLQLIVGSVTFVAGAAIWFFTRLRDDAPAPSTRPAWVPRLALALIALGLSTLAGTRRGVGWSVSSICFSIIAIVLIVMVLRDNMRRR